MNTRPPDMPTKLPAYSHPSTKPIHPPSPLSGEPGSLVNTLIVPVGCELIIQNPNPSKDASTLKLIKYVVAKIIMESPHLANLPLDVLGSGNASRDISSYFCYIRLFPSNFRPWHVTKAGPSLAVERTFTWSLTKLGRCVSPTEVMEG